MILNFIFDILDNQPCLCIPKGDANTICVFVLCVHSSSFFPDIFKPYYGFALIVPYFGKLVPQAAKME
jgi:hypothetical protein